MLAHNQSSIIKSSDEARQREGRQARSNYMSQPCAEPCHVMRMIPAPSSNLYVPHITLHGGLTHGHARSLSTGPLLAPVSPTAMRTPSHTLMHCARVFAWPNTLARCMRVRVHGSTSHSLAEFTYASDTAWWHMTPPHRYALMP